MNVLRYIIYIRVSTEEQKKSGLGLEAQEKYCMDYIAKNGERPIIFFKDEAVSSGLRIEDREGLNQAIDALQPGDIFLISQRDRIGRSVVENAILEREINKKGAKLITVNQDDSNMDAGIATLMKTMMDAFSQYERYIISKRTKAALAAKKARGERIGRVPYGYSLDENKRVVVNPIESSIVKQIYHYRNKEHLPFRSIANRLNAAGYRNRNGGEFTHGATNRLLANYQGLSCVVAHV